VNAIGDAIPAAVPREATRLHDVLHGSAGWLRRGAVAILPSVLILVVWEAAVRWQVVSPDRLPAPSAVWGILASHRQILLAQSIPTAVDTVLSFGLAMVCGLGLGVLIASFERFRLAVYPYVILFQLIPKVAVAPLFLVWFGIGMQSRVAFAMFVAFFPVLVSTIAGLTGASPSAMRLARSLRASRSQLLFQIQIPYAIPHLFVGAKVAATMAVLGIVIAEFVTAQSGLGYIIMFGASVGQTALVFAAVALLCGIGLALYCAVALAEVAARRWHGGFSAASG
jgi:ABC-type nitrate/sulfonate/bicarbonate transport system permease component